MKQAMKQAMKQDSALPSCPAPAWARRVFLVSTRLVSTYLVLACLVLTCLALAHWSSPAAAAELKELGCGKALTKGDGMPQLVVDENLHVLDQTRVRAKFDPGPPPPGYRITSIFCARSDIVPAPTDYKVVEAGYPLTIYARAPQDSGRTRIAVLELDDGKLRLRSVGELGFTPQMAQRIRVLLDSSVAQMARTGSNP